MVGLYRDSTHRLYCGGALISTKHILTAAHCVHNIPRKDIKIYLGGHNISTDYVDTRRVSRIFEHEYFDSVTFDFDIALLELSKPIQFGPKIQPACLPQTQFEDYSGKVAMIAGWGRLGNFQFLLLHKCYHTIAMSCRFKITHKLFFNWFQANKDLSLNICVKSLFQFGHQKNVKIPIMVNIV